MKDHVEIGHLTKYDTFRVNRDQVMDLEQGRSQDFAVGTHSFPSHLFTPHPPPKKRSKSFSIHVSFISNRVRKSLN